MKRSFVALAFVAVNLMACCCGGGIPKAPNVAAPAAEQPKAVLAKVEHKPDPPFVFKPIVLPARNFKPILSSSLADPESVSAKIIAELVSGEIAGAHLFLNVRVSNEGRRGYEHRTWQLPSSSGMQATGKDEHENRLRWIENGNTEVQTIAPGKSVDDTVVLQAPTPKAQEVDVRLPGENIVNPVTGKPLFPKQWFAFKIGRNFFAKKEDERLETAERERQLAMHKTEVAAVREAERLAEAKRAAEWEAEQAEVKAKQAAAREADRRESARKAEEEFEADGLVLLLKSVNGNSNTFGMEITGTVVNRNSSTIGLARIEYNIYDGSGARIATAFTAIRNLEAGGRWNFKAVGFGTGGSKYKLSDLSGR